MQYFQTPRPPGQGWLARLVRAWRAALRPPVPARNPARRFFLLGASAAVLSFAAACASRPVPATSAPPPQPPPPPPPPVWESSAPEAAAPGRSAGSGASLSAFPWQPPRPTARLELQEFTKPNYQTLGTIADTLAGAARMAGFGDAMYYSVPGGFAILVRPEAIGTNLRPLSPRFLDSGDPAEKPWLMRMIELVNEAYRGPNNSRQIAVIVTNQPIGESEDLREFSSEELERAFAGGARALPASVRNLPRPAGCKATAMVYHFQRTSNGRLSQRFVAAREETRIARQHLDRARLTALA